MRAEMYKKRLVRLSGAVLVLVLAWAGPAPAQQGPRRRDGKGLLRRFDTNRDGKLTKKELRDPRRFARWDANKDGVVDVAELRAVARRWTPGGRADKQRPAADTAGAKPSALSTFGRGGRFVPTCPIDHLVLATLKKKGIKPANLCSDEVFIRRVYLDVIGTVPEPQQVRQFLNDRRPGKRSARDSGDAPVPARTAGNC